MLDGEGCLEVDGASSTFSPFFYFCQSRQVPLIEGKWPPGVLFPAPAPLPRKAAGAMARRTNKILSPHAPPPSPPNPVSTVLLLLSKSRVNLWLLCTRNARGMLEQSLNSHEARYYVSQTYSNIHLPVDICVLYPFSLPLFFSPHTTLLG